MFEKMPGWFRPKEKPKKEEPKLNPDLEKYRYGNVSMTEEEKKKAEEKGALEEEKKKIEIADRSVKATNLVNEIEQKLKESR